MAEEQKRVDVVSAADAAFEAFETPDNPPANAPAPVSNPVAPQDSPAAGSTQHMGNPPQDGAPGATPAQPAPAQPAAPAAPAPSAPQQPVTAESMLKELSGGKYDSWDKIQADLSKPAEKVIETVEVQAPLKFANKEAESVYTAIAEGKYADVAPFIEQQLFVAKLGTMTDEQVVKAKLQREYPSLTREQIDEEYNETYVPDQLELNAASFERAKVKAQDKLAKDANKAKAEFLSIKPELNLPKPAVAQPPATPAAPVLSEASKQIAEFGKTFVADKVSKIEFGYESTDKNTSVKGELALPAEQVTTIAAKIKDNPEAFLSGFFNRWLQANGEYDVNAIARDVFYLDNPQLYVNNVAQASSVQTLEAVLRRTKNYAPQENRGSARSIMPTIVEADEAKMDAFFGIPATKS